MQDDNWDDLRFVLEVAEAGSVSAAARRLGVNASTVVRRVGAAEIRFGVRFFERTAAGYAVPPDSLDVIAALREARDAIAGMTRRLEGSRGAGPGWIRVTSTDTLCRAVLPGIIADLRAQAADRRVELLVSNTHLDFARLHADITVRPAPALSEEMVGEKVAVLRIAAFAPVRSTSGWVGLSGQVAATEPGRWLADNIAEVDLHSRADSFSAVADLVAAGAGNGFLPVILAEGRRYLRRRNSEPTFEVPIWVASHADMAHAPRLKRLREELGGAIAAIAHRL